MLVVGAAVFRKNLVRSVMESQVSLPEDVWKKLLTSWIAFFGVMGALNLYVAYNFSTDAWVNFKLFGGIGLMLAAIGVDPQTGSLRYTFGSLYLWDRLDLVPVVVGLFAIPEIVDLAGADWSRFAALILAPGVPLTHPEPHWTVHRAVPGGSMRVPASECCT